MQIGMLYETYHPPITELTHFGLVMPYVAPFTNVD